MPTFQARMRVTYEEMWTVDADNGEEARASIEALDDHVNTDDGPAELVDYEISSIKMEQSE